MIQGGRKPVWRLPQPVVGGYTVIEVMIFLAISVLLFGSAVALIGSQQSKTQFAQAMRDIDSQINAVINGVSSGYYPNSGAISCTANAGGITIDTTAAPPGSNSSCMFIGKVLQFGTNGTDGEGTALISVAARRQTINADGTKSEVQSLAQATPTAVSALNELDTLKWGLRITKIRDAATKTTDISAIGFISSFGRENDAKDLLSGAQTLQLVALPGVLNRSIPDVESQIASGLDAAAVTLGKQGVHLCFTDGNGKQRGGLIIGFNGQQLTTKLELDPSGSDLCAS